MREHLPVQFTESAILDLEDIRLYYKDRQVPEVGERFVVEIITAIEELPVFPERGRTVPEFNQPSLRELIHSPFRIVYHIDKQRISIVRVWRSERLLKLP